MKSFNVSNVRKYKAGEILECLNLVADKYANVPALPEKLVRRTNEMKAAVEELDKVFNETTAEDHTTSLNENDKERLAIVQSMKYYARSMMKRSKPEMVRMGEMLHKILEHNCSTIHNESQSQKTALINAFLKDVKGDPAMLASIEALDLNDQIEELADKNLAFAKLFETSAQEKKDPFNTFEKREIARELFVKLIEETQAFAITSDDPTVFEKLLKSTRKLLQKFDKPVMLRRSLRNKTNEMVADTPTDAQKDNAPPTEFA